MRDHDFISGFFLGAGRRRARFALLDLLAAAFTL